MKKKYNPLEFTRELARTLESDKEEADLRKMLRSRLNGLIARGANIEPFAEILNDIKDLGFDYNHLSLMKQVLVISFSQKDISMAFSHRMDKVNYLLQNFDWTKKDLTSLIECLENSPFSEVQQEQIRKVLIEKKTDKIVSAEENAIECLLSLGNSSSFKSFMSANGSSSSLSVKARYSAMLALAKTRPKKELIFLNITKKDGGIVEAKEDIDLMRTLSNSLERSIMQKGLSGFIMALKDLGENFSYDYQAPMRKVLLYSSNLTKRMKAEDVFEYRINKVNYLLDYFTLDKEDITLYLGDVERSSWWNEAQKQELRNVLEAARLKVPERTWPIRTSGLFSLAQPLYSSASESSSPPSDTELNLNKIHNKFAPRSSIDNFMAMFMPLPMPVSSVSLGSHTEKLQPENTSTSYVDRENKRKLSVNNEEAGKKARGE